MLRMVSSPLRTDFEDGDLVSGLTRTGQRKAPRRAYGTFKRTGRIWSIGNWNVDPSSVRKVKGEQRQVLVRIFQKTSGHCHFCGDPLDFEKFGRKSPRGWEKDHVIPKKRGGKRRKANLLPNPLALQCSEAETRIRDVENANPGRLDRYGRDEEKEGNRPRSVAQGPAR